MAILDSLTQLASQHFASPIGLIALASLIPLIIFYLVRPQPEEQIMPSMMFFMADKESGTVSQAIDRLMSNLLLILHILFIVGMAAAIAQPIVSGLDTKEKAVVVVDRSASMEDDFKQAKDFAKANLGQENTVIVSDENVNVALESGSASEARSYINSLETRDVRTDIRSGLETARDYEGPVYIASDLAQTVNADDASEIAENIQTERTVEVMESNQDNDWGIVEVKPARENSTVEVRNFMDEDTDITLTVNNATREINVESEETKPVNVRTVKGRNKVELEEDGLSSDNTAYIMIPGQGEFDVTFIADEENPYFREAINSIPSTSYNYKEPPIEGELDADIYVVGETRDLLKQTAEDIDSEVKNGRSLVLFGQAGFNDLGFQSSPARLGSRINTSVEIREPIRTTIGSTEIYQTSNRTGESYSDPAGAIVRRDFGKGEVLLYNIQDEDFRFEFLYPIFWKNTFNEISDIPSIEETNLRTGAQISGSRITLPSGQELDGPINAYESGFYETPGNTYAVNMESQKESASEPVEFESKSRLTGEQKQNIQHFAVAILALLAVMELLYLIWLGDL